MILDAGFLISVDRGERTAHTFLTAASRSKVALHTTHPIMAQVWRSGSRQARLAGFLKTIIIHPFEDGHPVGRILAETGASDVVDAHLVIIAMRLGHDILTGDPDDLTMLTSVLGPAAPTVHSWP